MWYNPASLTDVGRQVSLSGVLTSPDSTFKADSASGDTILDDAVIPTLSLAYPLDEYTTLGLNINVPFGNKRDYEDDFIGLNEASYSEIKTTNINLALGHKINDVLALGVGINYQTIEADLQASTPTPVGNADRQLKGDDDAYALNIGLRYTPDNKTAFGIAYRSSTDFLVDGNVDTVTPVGALLQSPQVSLAEKQALQQAVAGGQLALTDKISNTIPANASVKMPSSLNLSVSNFINEKTQLLFSTVYTQWDSLQSLDIKRKADGAILSSEKFEWNNTMQFSVGANYHYSDKMTLRGGLSYDQTPVPNPALRSLRSPDSSRTWFSVGANYQVNSSLNIDAGYSYVSLKDAKVVRDTFTGSYETDANILGLQANWKF